MNKQTLHTRISYIKSFIRLIGYGTLLVNIGAAVFILIISELLGIIEETIYE